MSDEELIWMYIDAWAKRMVERIDRLHSENNMYFKDCSNDAAREGREAVSK